ncbi:D-tagatose-bisphosphate aldolase, class II, non-catalytic subunit [Thalassotalea sp. PP2-459]|uniref:D-tagatose-bisphosphate aldolase, class II, non-catalytic subunit n=1 Tax=Thalassotalea sp. PP2-459 TaxID=1742724 RepID=UPI000943CA3F|nr:D-tagatose-bisphosphate aldolase, class II, non-catalytic subunit [Thalassotalea sp. PP2-459]OKY26210.1 D-tagatose-bisphosphate aldolase, class II, non-catalytic subunit [Thalassotalea sp. PP2-459]
MTKIVDIINSNRNDVKVGIYSVCCAQPLIIEAAIKQAQKNNSVVLIEATANQVNQFGGYTSMKPADYVTFITSIAEKLNFPMEKVILGGDHLGPVCWVTETAQQAMEKSKTLIKSYVAAGFKKIHLDTSMPCADDEPALTDEIIAERAAILCEIAEKTAIETFGQSDILYVIGTEVPPPGGATEEITSLEVTPKENVAKTYDIHLAAFEAKALTDAWQRVIGIVVQPGVEFDHTSIIDYNAKKAQSLSQFIKTVPNIVFEAHSTDYQKPSAYKALVADHFAILKVGPQLTFAMREALFALSFIEQAYIEPERQANLMAVFEAEMQENPGYWQKFYQVAPEKEMFYRQYSYSDRIRYYWNTVRVEQAVQVLLENLTKNAIPLPLISQFLPEQYQALREGEIQNCPHDLVVHKIMQVTEVYANACNQQSPL